MDDTPAPEAGPLHTDGAVGQRLRALRHRRRSTLAELAAATGLTSSTLSRLETGRRRPTLEQLVPLTTFYDVPLHELVGAPRAGDPRVHLRPVTRDGMTFVPLSRRPGGIQAFKVVYPPASRWGAPVPRTHEGHLWFFVLNGAVRLVLDGEEFVVRAGEVAELDSRTSHWLGSADETPAELIMLMGPQGERMRPAVTPP